MKHSRLDGKLFTAFFRSLVCPSCSRTKKIATSDNHGPQIGFEENYLYATLCGHEEQTYPFVERSSVIHRMECRDLYDGVQFFSYEDRAGGRR